MHLVLPNDRHIRVVIVALNQISAPRLDLYPDQHEISSRCYRRPRYVLWRFSHLLLAASKDQRVGMRPSSEKRSCIRDGMRGKTRGRDWVRLRTIVEGWNQEPLTHTRKTCGGFFEEYISQLEGPIREGDQFGSYKNTHGVDMEGEYGR